MLPNVTSGFVLEVQQQRTYWRARIPIVFRIFRKTKAAFEKYIFLPNLLMFMSI